MPITVNQEPNPLERVSFDADFESANCDMVKRVSTNEFHVFMRNDTNGSGLLQWFYFRMRNAGDFVGVVKIVIANFTKKDSLFNKVSISSNQLTYV